MSKFLYIFLLFCALSAEDFISKIEFQKAKKLKIF